MKSTSTCLFFYSLGLYWMPYSLNSIDQRAILPNKSGFVWCFGEGGRLVPQWDAPESRGEASWLLSGGLRRPTQDDYTWSLHRLKVC